MNDDELLLAKINAWKWKADKWDANEAESYRRAFDFSKIWVTKDKFNELEKKAKQWDDHAGGHFTVPYWEETVEKAKKWDSLLSPDSIFVKNSYLNELKDKARILDERLATSQMSMELYDELKDKAAKWDEAVKKQETGHVYNWNFGSGTMDDVKTWMEKAKKYDEFVAVDRNLVQIEKDEYDQLVERASKYAELSDKAGKWNEFRKNVEISRLYAEIDIIKSTSTAG